MGSAIRKQNGVIIDTTGSLTGEKLKEIMKQKKAKKAKAKAKPKAKAKKPKGNARTGKRRPPLTEAQKLKIEKLLKTKPEMTTREIADEVGSRWTKPVYKIWYELYPGDKPKKKAA